MSVNPEPYEGICPKCGKWNNLDERTGWCHRCTYPSLYTGDRPQDVKDRIHELRQEGMSREAAQRQAYAERRPNCVICGDPISYGRVTSLFCGKELCRKISARFSYLTRYGGKTREEALAKILEENASRD